jgi:hypothetical protein
LCLDSPSTQSIHVPRTTTMTDQWQLGQPGLHGEDFAFPSECFLDADPFSLFDFDNLFNDQIWAGIQTPRLNGPTASGIDLSLDNRAWLDSEPSAFNMLDMNNVSISDGLDVSLSYQIGHKPDFLSTSSSSGLATPFTSTEPSPGSSIQTTSQLLPPSPRQSRKRRIEDFQSEFMGPQPAGVDKRRRQPFKSQRRLEVGAVRKAGACIRCRVMKTPVIHHPPI